ASPLPHPPGCAQPGGRLQLLRVVRRVDAGPGDAAHRSLAPAAPARGAVPPDRKPRPPRPGLRHPGALVALPRPRDHRRLEALRPPRPGEGRRRQEGRRPGREPRHRAPRSARTVAGPAEEPLVFPPPYPLRNPAPEAGEGGGPGRRREAEAPPRAESKAGP